LQKKVINEIGEMLATTFRRMEEFFHKIDPARYADNAIISRHIFDTCLEHFLDASIAELR
jgi:hypothetical protein